MLQFNLEEKYNPNILKDNFSSRTDPLNIIKIDFSITGNIIKVINV